MGEASEVRTLVRQTGEKATGWLMMAGSAIVGIPMWLWFLGEFWKNSPEDGILGLFVGVACVFVFSLGKNKVRKANHIAWTLEALARDRDLRPLPNEVVSSYAENTTCSVCGTTYPSRSAFHADTLICRECHGSLGGGGESST